MATISCYDLQSYNYYALLALGLRYYYCTIIMSITTIATSMTTMPSMVIMACSCHSEEIGKSKEGWANGSPSPQN